MQLQVESIGQCNRELLKEKTELQQKIEAGPNASAETDVAVMNIALYKEKIKVSLSIIARMPFHLLGRLVEAFDIIYFVQPMQNNVLF